MCEINSIQCDKQTTLLTLIHIQKSAGKDTNIVRVYLFVSYILA